MLETGDSCCTEINAAAGEGEGGMNERVGRRQRREEGGVDIEWVVSSLIL